MYCEATTEIAQGTCKGRPDGSPTLSGSEEILGVDSFDAPLEAYSEMLLVKNASSRLEFFGGAAQYGFKISFQN